MLLLYSATVYMVVESTDTVATCSLVNESLRTANDVSGQLYFDYRGNCERL